MARRKPDSHPVPAPRSPGSAASGISSVGTPLAPTDADENSASELIESPQRPGHAKLDPHDFADGGGGGGAEAFSRKKTK